MPLRLPFLFAALALFGHARAETLSATRLGILYNIDDPSSRAIAEFYAARRSIPATNVLGVHLGNANILSPEAFSRIRSEALGRLPAEIQSLALVWSRPFAAGCMSITTAFAAGYRPAFCEPGCKHTIPSPLFDSDGWLPADTVGWWPAMLIPTEDSALAHALIERGLGADGTAPRGSVYLVRTPDANRNVRAATYSDVESVLAPKLNMIELTTPVTREIWGAIGYFTGAPRVDELPRIHFIPGAIADHLTSTGGRLSGGSQMPVISWLIQGATASYGNVSEPCSHLEKFPNIGVLLRHYVNGETVMEAYWKSVAMPGQGLFIGEPLARPFATRRQ